MVYGDDTGRVDCGSRKDQCVFGRSKLPQRKAQRRIAYYLQPSSSRPASFLPSNPSLGAPDKANSLSKTVGCGNQPVGVDEDSSTEMQAPVQQAGLPWPLASQCVLATEHFPNHLRLPTHCGDTPMQSIRDTVPEGQNNTTRRLLLHFTDWKTMAKDK